MSAPATNRASTAADGFIIVAVLWMLAALATLVSIYAIYVVETASVFSVHENRLQTEALVAAATELVAYQLTATTKLPRPTHGAFNFHLGKAAIAVAFQSESARIDLNAAPKELLAGLFRTIGASPDLAATYASRIVSWRNPAAKDQAKDDQVRAQAASSATPEPGSAPPASRFFHVDELSLVPGLPIAMAERALPFVTIYNGRPQINVLEAAPVVLASVPGMTKNRLDAILAARQAPVDGKAVLQLLGPAQGFATIESGNAVRIRIRINYDDGHRSTAEVIILTFDAGGEPYSVLSWSDDMEFVADDSLGMASQ
jgi:general secretion pathway protein K